MNSRVLAGFAALSVLLVGCREPERSPGLESEQVPAAVLSQDTASTGAATEGPTGDASQMGPGRRGPMSGRMGEMHARMMGGGAGEAPEVTATPASAPGCPDVTQELTDSGREVYGGSGNCFTCHGGDATGSQLAPDLTDDDWLNVDGNYASIVEVIRTGVSRPRDFSAPMPPMGGASLSQDQLCAVAAYVYSLSR